MKRPSLVLAAALAAFLAAAAEAQDPLARAKDLYASAEYESALAALGEARQAPGLDRGTVLAIEQYRALCLLATRRRAEAEQAIEAVLDLDPFYLPGEEDAAPWVRAAFREVRQRVLPGTLQELYGRGKQAFERKDYAESEADFRQVLRVLQDPDLSLDEGARADMRLVVQGFLDLAAAARTVAAPPPAPAAPEASGRTTAPAGEPPVATATPSSAQPPATEPQETAGALPPVPPPQAEPPSPSPAAPPGPAGPIFDSTAADVVPPLPLRQSVTIPEQARPAGAASGLVEVVIARDGSIESAEVRQSFGGVLDQVVLQAVQAWRYRPAHRAGVPVRYRRLVRIVLPAR